MLYTANVSFAGVISMMSGETRDLTEEQVRGLAPYVDPVEGKKEGKLDDDVTDKPCRRKAKAKDRL